MLKKLFVTAVLIAIPSLCFASALQATGGMLRVTGGTLKVYDVPTPPSCTMTLTDSDTSASTGDADIGYQASRTYVATRFVAGSNYTLCSVDAYLKKTVTDSLPVWIIQAEIWSNDDGTKPLALLATSTNTKTAADLAVAYGWINFTFAGIALTNGTTYWIAIHATTLGDFGDWPSWSIGTNFTQYALGDATPVWDSAGSEALNYRTYR